MSKTEDPVAALQRIMDYTEQTAKIGKKQGVTRDGFVFQGLVIGLLMGLTHGKEAMDIVVAMERTAKMPGDVKKNLRWTVEYLVHGNDKESKHGK